MKSAADWLAQLCQELNLPRSLSPSSYTLSAETLADLIRRVQVDAASRAQLPAGALLLEAAYRARDGREMRAAQLAVSMNTHGPAQAEQLARNWASVVVDGCRAFERTESPPAKVLRFERPDTGEGRMTKAEVLQHRQYVLCVCGDPRWRHKNYGAEQPLFCRACGDCKLFRPAERAAATAEPAAADDAPCVHCARFHDEPDDRCPWALPADRAPQPTLCSNCAGARWLTNDQPCTQCNPGGRP